MAHPTQSFPGSVYHLDAVSEPLKPDGGYVYAIANTDTAAGTVSVKSSVFEFRTTSESIVDHIDPTTGVLGVASTGLADGSGNATVAGYYEKDNADAVTLNINAGQTIYGRFSEVVFLDKKLVAYTNTDKQVGLKL